MAYVTARKDTFCAGASMHAFTVHAHQITWIPDDALNMALSHGCIETDEHGKLLFNRDLTETDAPENPDAPSVSSIPTLTVEERADDEKRISAIVAGIRYLVAVGDPKDFRKDNFPKAMSLERVLGFNVTIADLTTAFEIFQKE
jgi:hypothetical protein